MYLSCSHSLLAWAIFSAKVCLFPKNIGFSYAFFQRYYYYSKKHPQPSILQTALYNFLMLKCPHFLKHFSSLYFTTQSPWNKLLIEAAIFSEQQRLYWNESSHLKPLFFQKKTFSKRLVLWRSYIFLITTSR